MWLHFFRKLDLLSSILRRYAWILFQEMFSEVQSDDPKMILKDVDLLQVDSFVNLRDKVIIYC